ncbi:MAG: hypothetical protein PWR20_1659 [Bacteroidales bacterium]|jgi:carbon monoxide dehydrogenase subunit G|nr:hypothetical protein [Bacteroidales bacterium]MDN5328572.1 hypothetical protein [Bacteroidales bacterium]
MEVKSTPHLVNRPATELYARLTDLSRFGHSLPPQVTNFHTEGDTCSFTIQGMADITLNITHKTPNHIIYSNSSEKPFPFHLHFYLEEEDLQSTRLTVAFEGELNPMLAIMARGPLQNFVNMVVDKIAEKGM